MSGSPVAQGAAATDAAETVDAATFRSAMRHLAGAVCVITTGEPGARSGLTATAVCSISADPPRVLICVNRNARTHESIFRNRRVGINALRRSHVWLARRFAGMVPGTDGEARFAEGRWAMVAGAPLLDDACMALACRVVEAIPASTHTMFLCEVVAARRAEPATDRDESLIYLDGHFRELAPVERNEPPIEWLW